MKNSLSSSKISPEHIQIKVSQGKIRYFENFNDHICKSIYIPWLHKFDFSDSQLGQIL